MRLTFSLVTRLTTLSLCALAFSTGEARAQNCGILSEKGIYDTSEKSTDEDRSQSFYNWFCRTHFTSRGSFQQAAISLGIPLDEIPLNIGASDTEQRWEQTYNQICSQTQSASQFKQRLRERIAVINSRVVAALEHCLTQNGLHVWVESKANSETFLVKARYVPSGEKNSALITSIDFDNDVTCKPDVNTKKFRIGPNGMSFLCKKKNIKDWVNISINASEFVNKDGALEAPFWEPPPPPDICQNLPGIQETLPPGMIFTATGICSPPPPKYVRIGPCAGHGGIEGKTFWGPQGQLCNNIPAWGTYGAFGMPPNPMICSCIGHEGTEGVRLWGLRGAPCGGVPAWGTYSEQCMDLAAIQLCSCVGHGAILEGHYLWGPFGMACGGMSAPVWGSYAANCVAPQ